LHGPGLGWRPALAWWIERFEGLGFVEVMAEDIPAAGLPELEVLRARGLTIVPHGVSLGLGDAGKPSRRRLKHLAKLAERLDAPFVSEHIAFVRAGGLEAGHLLPVPRTRDSLAILVDNVKLAQAQLPVPLVLENIAPYFDWPGDELDEPAFLAELLERTGAGFLLDLSNLYARSVNTGVQLDLDRLPWDRLTYVHVGGGVLCEGHYDDTHAHPVSPEILALVEQVAKRAPGAAWMLERDGNFPAEAELRGEVAAIAAAWERGRG
jgi:uncharacterized protein (UPF0276 family)